MNNKKSTKRALLSSVLSLALCMTMLIGTTFAWFTDSVTSTGNTIQSGTLKVDLVNEAGASMEGQVIKFIDKDTNNLWEPGCTYETEPVYVVNKGNLALKYQMVVNGITGDAKLLEAIEWTVTIGEGTDKEVVDLSTFEGNLYPEDGKNKSKAIVLSGHMKEEAGNEYQGLTVDGISISVFATQLTAEFDSISDQYDALATYMNKNADGEWEINDLGQFIYFAKSVNEGNAYNGETIVLTNDINLAGLNWAPIGSEAKPFKGTFDGQDNTISNLTINAPTMAEVGLFGHAVNATIKGINVKNANVVGYQEAAAIVGSPYTGCTISDCHVTGEINIVAEYAYAGGIAAYGYVDIENCSVIADGTGTITAKDRNAVGGIMAWLLENNNSIKNCEVKNLDLTGWANIGSIAGFVHYNNVVEGCTAENINLVKTRVDGVHSIGALFGGWCYGANKNITVSNNTVKDVTMSGNAIAYDYDKKELYGSEYYAKTDNIIVESGNSYEYESNVVVVTVAESADALVAALANGGKVVLTADITGVDANTAITVAAGKSVTLDLNGHKITATANKNGNQELFLVKGTMTVENGALELVAQNNQAWNAMATIFDVTAGGVLKVDGVTANVAGTDMNFFAHLNNWGSATLEMTNCDITTTYVAVRAFNSGNDMNTITIKDTDFHNGRMFWVHNYTSEGKDDSTLTLDIYGNNNTSDNAKPVRFGFSNSIYYDINGNLIP